MSADVARCEVCGWPLAASVAEGCVPGNCSMRPRPSPTYAEMERMPSAGSAGLKPEFAGRETKLLREEIARLRELLDRSWVHVDGTTWAMKNAEMWVLRPVLAFPFGTPVGPPHASLEDLLAAIKEAK